MATVISVTCPADGLSLTMVDADARKNEQDDRDNHLHIPVLQDVQCLNGHRWRLSGDLLLERVKG